ncbi:hypothetical protein K466DRAFT_600173 [Polyporus arcularius HHB13444]|uniref:Uncharacterized protein n=1 Tax=Polyporus arcularius HHB13444 TaxID=1314778 RepID=A0A5C3PA81_9APHY|nr:hypothetical protein K466DRAFT_600173 [Polyporus arcularius HHB13444]
MPKRSSATLSSDAQTKILHKLLDDSAVRPAVTAAIQSVLGGSLRSYSSEVKKKLRQATKELRTTNHQNAKYFTLNDFPDATKAAYDLLLEVAEESIPGGSNADDDAEGRKRFDETADAMLVTLAKKRREEEGDDFKFADTLERMVKTAKRLEEEKGIEWWFPSTIALMQEWSGTAGTSTAAQVEHSSVTLRVASHPDLWS